MNCKAKFQAVSNLINNFNWNQFKARKQLEILQQEISVEANLWFGATWDSKKEEYISDKGNSVNVLRQNQISI